MFAGFTSPCATPAASSARGLADVARDGDGDGTALLVGPRGRRIDGAPHHPGHREVRRADRKCLGRADGHAPDSDELGKVWRKSPGKAVGFRCQEQNAIALTQNLEGDLASRRDVPRAPYVAGRAASDPLDGFEPPPTAGCVDGIPRQGLPRVVARACQLRWRKRRRSHPHYYRAILTSKSTWMAHRRPSTPCAAQANVRAPAGSLMYDEDRDETG
jgi:hypothetical protein